MAAIDAKASGGTCDSETAAYVDNGRDARMTGRKTGGEPGQPGFGGSSRQMASLVKAIEGEIVPRLVLSRRAARNAAGLREGDDASPDDRNVRELAMMLLKHDATVALAYVESIREVGTPLSAIYLNLLAPAACRLGELWREDRCTFVEVTLGLCSLHQVLRSLSPQFVAEASAAGRGRRILLVPAPGEQHTFGLMMVVEFFRRSGWDVRYEAAECMDDLVRLVRGEWFSVIGLSLGCESRIESVAPAIRSLRRASCNRGLGVMVGGSVINTRPDLVPLMGADATAADGIHAVHQAERMSKLLTVRI